MSATSLAASSTPPPDSMLGAPLAATFRREVEGRVDAIALEKLPHAAALGGGTLWMHEATGWRSEPLPKSLTTDPAPSLSIFFGRDYRVRITGSHAGDPNADTIYYRWRNEKLEHNKTEIGKLGGAPGPLVAILGVPDPEIVCRPGDICIVKTFKGWQTIQAPVDIELVTIGEGHGWGVAGHKLLTLEKEWHTAGPEGSWSRADAIFATGREAWIVEAEAAKIHAFDGASWRVIPSPIARPRALWGATRDALWLVGDGGLAFFDGSKWHEAPDAPRPLAAVLGRNADDVWVGGAAGLFHVAGAAGAATRSSAGG